MIETRVDIDWMIHFISVVHGAPSFIEYIDPENRDLVDVYNEIIRGPGSGDALVLPQYDDIPHYDESDTLGM
jgi:hypothetical protein